MYRLIAKYQIQCVASDLNYCFVALCILHISKMAPPPQEPPIAPDPAAKPFGKCRFVVDAADIKAAQSARILRGNVDVQCVDSSNENYGIAYDRQDNIASEEFPSQKAVRERCKEFAIKYGFQIFVKQTSVKVNNSGNAKYQCKKLNGVHFFDTDIPSDQLECPFSINVYGLNGKWKITKANFAHNHTRGVGFTRTPCVEGTIPHPTNALRNTTQDVQSLTTLIVTDLLPLHGHSTANLSGATIGAFFKSRGFDVCRSAISRMKADIDERLRGDIVESYQKLEAYFQLMTEKNADSVWKIERESNNATFRRACFIPNLGIHIAKCAKRLVGFDGAHLKGLEMNKRGVFLVATTKDFNNHVTPFALALVSMENYENWQWFMNCVKSATGLEKFTIVSDRQKGLLSAVAEVFPLSGHRYCLRHIMDNINRKGGKLSIDERRIICQLARSDCENDFKLFRSELAASNPVAVEYLDGIEAKHWVKYKFREAFGLPTFNEITSNLSEQVNNWLGTELRSAKPLDAFYLYFRKLSELASEKRQDAGKWTRSHTASSLVPQLQAQLKDRTTAAGMCDFVPLMDGAYSVQHLGPQNAHGHIHTWRLVDLPAQECTCGNWQDEEFPCLHALCAATQDGRRIEDLYDHVKLSIANFAETYTFRFRPWPNNVSLATDSTLLIPLLQVDEERLGKRGLKPGPKPKHKRKQAKNPL